MSTLAAQPDAPSDAELISRVRAGDQAAYGVLFERHSEAARRMARQLVSGPDVDDLVSEAFTKVLIQLQRGGGPDVAFRAYLLTAIRRLHVDRARINKRLHVTDDLDALDQDVEFDDPATASFERGAASRAFASLPERWQLVLWHLEVEGQKPADIAPLLGMSPNSVAALAYRAREGLRQAYLQSHLADTADATCRWTTEHLGAYVRKGLAKRDSAKVEEHLNGCHRCTAVYLELTEVNSNLSGLLAPALLGIAAAPGYLAASGTHLGLVLLTPWTKLKEAGAAVQSGVAAAAVAAVVTVAAVAGGIGGGGDEPEQAAESALNQPAPGTDNQSPDSDDSQPDESDQAPQTDNEPPPEQSEQPPPDDETEPPPVDDEPDDDGPDDTVPESPTNVSGDVAGSDAVLSWSPVPDATGYRVYRRASSTAQARASLSFAASAVNASYVPTASARVGSLISGTITETSYRDSTLVDGTNYTYSITSVGPDGEESEISEPITVTYDPEPAVPTALSGVADGTGVVLRWQPNSEPDLGSYEILRDGEHLATSTEPTFTDASVVDGSSYEYEVAAIDRAGQASDASSPVPVAYDPAPAAPTGVTAELRDGQVVVSWAPNEEPDLRGYEVFRDGTPIGRTTTPGYTDGDIVDGQTYAYTVVAIDATDQRSAESAAASTTYDPAPAAPTGVTAQVRDDKVAVQWNASDEVDLKTYEVYRDGIPIGRTATPGFTDADVTDGKTYSYSVAAIDNADQTSPRSEAATATYDPAPAAPTGLSAKPIGHHVELSWNASNAPDVGSYRVYREGTAIATVDRPAYVDDKAPEGKTTYSVTAIDKAGHESNKSDSASADLEPDAPTGLAATGVEGGISLGWNRVNSDIAAYYVMRDGERIAETSTTSYIDRTATEATPYTYTVRAVDGSGNVSAPSNEEKEAWDVTPPAPTGFRCEVGELGDLRMWWNPPAPDIAHYDVWIDGRFLVSTHDPDATDVGGHTGEATHKVRVVAVDGSDHESPPGLFTCQHDAPGQDGQARADSGDRHRPDRGESGSRPDGHARPERLGGFGLR